MMPQVMALMQEKGLQGSKDEVLSLLRENNVPVSDFVDKANSVLKNPAYMWALKKAGAPIDQIKEAVAMLGGAGGANAQHGMLAPGGKLRRL